jgi:hypothetical protein
VIERPLPAQGLIYAGPERLRGFGVVQQLSPIFVTSVDEMTVVFKGTLLGEQLCFHT